jgi:hypothetical protein
MLDTCLIFFEIFGFHPAINRRAQSYKSALIINILSTLNCVLIIGNISFMIIAQDWMFYSKTAIGKINDILLYGSLIFAHLSIVIESFMQRKYFIQYWSFYERIVSFKKSIWYKQFLLKFMSFIVFTIVIEAIVIFHIYGVDLQWTNFWCVEIFSLIATRVRNLQHVFFIDLLFFTLQDMNATLKNLNFWTMAINPEAKFSRKHFFSKVSVMKKDFKNMMEMIICVNRIFRWSQVFNITQQFIEIFSELYWIYAFAESDSFIWGEEN